METRMRTRVVATVAAVAALAVAVAAPASAHRGHGGHGIDRVTYPVELIYDNDVTEGRQDYVMFVGAPAEDLCGDVCPTCPEDLAGDGSVGVTDFLELLGVWGGCSDCEVCPADFDGDCAVDIGDFLTMLSNWG